MTGICKSAELEEGKASVRVFRHEVAWESAEIHRSPRARKIRAWEVVHACDFARDIADVIEAQIGAGMRPYLLTVGADVAPKPSVFQTWQDVRRWKKALDESGAQTTPQIIHAHSFSSGMAAVRMGACTVYDLQLTIEERLTLALIASEGNAAANSPGSWLARSFRTAEQFVLTKASAVVVHSPAAREECIGRGVTPAGVFVVPELQHESRNAQSVAEKYDAVYRHAFSRRNKGKTSGDSSGALIPIQANL